jgi:hypothetical protein
MSMSVNRPAPIQPQDIRRQSPSTLPQNDGGNNLYRGSSIIPESAFVDKDTITVTPENIGRLGGDVMLSPDQMKELYEKGSLQVQRQFQTAESNEGFMTLTAKLAAALVGPSRSIAAIQIDPLFLEMIKDPNAKVGMGYTQVEKETWTVMPSPEQKNLEPPIMPPKPVPPYQAPPVPEYTQTPAPEPKPKPKPEPQPEGDIYRIARTSGQAGDNKAIVARYRAEGFPPLGNGESVGDSTYDGATAEAILGRDMQVPFQYVGRANLEFNGLNSSDSTIRANARSWTQTMANKVGFEYHVGKDGKAYLTDPQGTRVPPDGKVFKSAVAKEVGLGNFENYQNLQQHVKFVQSVGYTDPLNATALSGQVAEQSPEQVQKHLNHKFGGHSLDNTRHEYFTTNDLKQFPSVSGNGTRLDDYRAATENTPVPADNLDEYRNLYNTYNSPPLSMEQIQAANPTLKDMYALHAQQFQPGLGITFSNGKANVPEASTESVLNARIVLESNTSNGKEDELLYDSASVSIINQRVAQVFTGADMQLTTTDGKNQQVAVPQDKIVDFLGFHKESTLEGADSNSIFNDVESQITRRYNEGNNTNYQTVGNGFVPARGRVETATPTPVASNDDTTVGQSPAGDTTVGQTPAGDTPVVAETPTGTTTVTQTPAANAGTAEVASTTETPDRSKYTSQSIYDAILINTRTANSSDRYPPGTAEHLEKSIQADAAELKSRIQASPNGSITVGNVTLTEADVDKMVADTVAPLEAMTLRESRDLAENPPQMVTPPGGEPRPMFASEQATAQLGELNNYMRAALRDDSIQPAERDAIVQRVETISANLFADLSNKGVVSGPYSPDALSQVTPEMIRAKISDPEQANSMISAVENLNYTASQVGMISDLNHATSLSRRVRDLSQRLDTFQQVEVAKKAFTGGLSTVANLSDPQVFNNFVAESYNLQPYDNSAPADSPINAQYEILRSAAKKGALPFPPTIQVVDPSELNGADGAYVNPDGKLESGQIMISRDILNQPERLKSVFAEEMFHHLEHMSEIHSIGDKTDKTNKGENFEAAGDEGRAAVYALRSIQSGKTSQAEIASAADTGRNQASTVRSGGNITMRADGSDRGTYRTASGGTASIEFSSPTDTRTETSGNTTPQGATSTEEQTTPVPGVGQYAAVDMDVTPRNPHPTRNVDMRGTDPQLFNAVQQGPQLDEAAMNRLNQHPETEDKPSPMGAIMEGLPNVFLGAAKTMEAHAQRLQELVQKFFLGQNGVANSFASDADYNKVMGNAQTLNGYHNTNPDLKLAPLSANYSRRPEYGNQNAAQINKNRDDQYAAWDRQLQQNNARQEASTSGYNAVLDRTDTRKTSG